MYQTGALESQLDDNKRIVSPKKTIMSLTSIIFIFKNVDKQFDDML